MVLALSAPQYIVKRNGEQVSFDIERIRSAITRAMSSQYSREEIEHRKDQIDGYVLYVKNIVCGKYQDEIPTVEDVQDIVQMVLMSVEEYEVAEHYIIYRHERTKLRELGIPENVVLAFKDDEPYFPTLLQQVQFLDKYSRWNDKEGRRETWIETVWRTVQFLQELVVEHAPHAIDKIDWEEIEFAIREMRVMPSMRILAMAGPAARRNNACIYNCTYVPIDSINGMVEVMLLSMNGCGVGFSVEDKYIRKLSVVSELDCMYDSNNVYVVDDSTEGWCDALYMGLAHWLNGHNCLTFDFSKIRPKGSILRTKGGRASGPEPLEKLLDFIKNRILARRGKRLTSLDVHDIVCAIGGAVVSGGVRRTALISIFDEDDELMLNCKNGDFEKENSQRWNANNSAVWTNVADMTQKEFVKRIWNTVSSERGEPGIFSRDIARNTIPTRRDKDHDFGPNPCGEIVLRPFGMCNLTSCIARPGDTKEDLEYKVRIATIIGTIQSLATHFPGLRPQWEQTAKEERLLGVDITGQMDCEILSLDSSHDIETTLVNLRELAIETNKGYAQLLRINQSAAITCIKPSGNTSVLVDASPGIHPRWAQYYIRNIRITAGSPLAKVLEDSGVELNPENGNDPDNPITLVASFPVKSPNNAFNRHEISAERQFGQWLSNKLAWTEHNPSVSIYYSDDEILTLMNRMYSHRTMLGGVTIFPKVDAKFAQLPLVEITEEEYNERVSKLPKRLKAERLWLYEKEDNTKAAQELACTAGLCEL